MNNLFSTTRNTGQEQANIKDRKKISCQILNNIFNHKDSKAVDQQRQGVSGICTVLSGISRSGMEVTSKTSYLETAVLQLHESLHRKGCKGKVLTGQETSLCFQNPQQCKSISFSQFSTFTGQLFKAQSINCTRPKSFHVNVYAFIMLSPQCWFPTMQ